MKIKDNLYMMDSTKGSYVYLITGEENVLIDTGLPHVRGRLLKELDRIGIDLKSIKHILLTHYDMDHIGNLECLLNLTGADVWASAEDIPYIYGDIDRPGFKKYLKYVSKAKIPRIIKPYGSEGSVNWIEVIPTPGHTPGHVCMLYQDVLFAGDLVENKNGRLGPLSSFFNWNNELSIKSIEKMKEYQVQWICPAHGAPVRGNTNLLQGK